MIDAHVHVFPDETAGRGWQTAVGFEPVRPGTVDDLSGRMEAAGIERAVVLLFPRSAQRAAELRAAAGPDADDGATRATVAGELDALNRWGCELARVDPRFVTFVGANPRFQSADELVASIRRHADAGARGVKIIPPAMSLYPDDPLLEPVYATCVELGLPLLSQSGAGGGTRPGPRGHYGRPAGWDPVLRSYPALRLVLAHLGHGFEDELVDLSRRHDSVLSDTSLRLGHPRDREPWDPAALRALIGRVGAERVLFGTNYPITDPVEYRARFDRLGLTAADAARVGGENARLLLAM